MERDLTGRCGTCGFFVSIWTNEAGTSEGECRLGCWPAPLKDTATCSSHKPIGESFEKALQRKKAAGTPRRYRDDDRTLPTPRNIPEEIGIDMDQEEFRKVLRDVLLDELGITDGDLGDRWRGGELVLIPGKEGTQERRFPIEQLFSKIIMIRDKLRVLEQKVNAHKGLSPDEKIQMQQYITGCYGSLTTFNVLFRRREDGFVGQGGKD